MADLLVDITKKFLQMEAENDSLVEACVLQDGLNYWPILRVLFWECFNSLTSPVYERFMAGRNALTHYTFAVEDGVEAALQKVPAGGCAYFSRAQCHAFQIRGRVFDPYLDPIAFVAQRQGIAPIKFHIATNKEHENYFLQPLIIPFITRKSPVVLEEIPVFAGYREYLKISLASGIPALPLCAIAQSVLMVLAYAELFTSILSTMRPSVVILEEYYNAIAQGLALACHRLQIPCADYQHGVQTGHLAYNFHHIPQKGFAAVPEWFFTWGEYDALRYKTLFAHQHFHKAASVGKPDYLAWKMGRLQESEDVLASLKARVAGKKVVCVPLQGAFLAFPELEPLIQDSPPDWLWLLRQHPLLHLDVEPLLKKFPDKVESAAATSLSLHTVLSLSRHIVFQQSSVAVEGECLHGLQSTTFSDDAQFFYADRIKNGSVYYAASLEDGLRNIAQAMQNYPYVPMEPTQVTRDEHRLGTLLRALHLQWRQKQDKPPK